MLAHRFADHHHKLPPEFFIQPKLNGVRALYHNGLMQSRDEVLWKPDVVAHLVAPLTQLVPSNFVLDGELYVHGWSLQRINGAISVVRAAPSDATKLVQYHVFDIYDLNDVEIPFGLRAEMLANLNYRFYHHPLLYIVETQLADLQKAETYYGYYRRMGYEGLMYRHPAKPYGMEERCGNKENRWPWLLKRKEWMDDEFQIVDFTITTGAKGNRGFQVTCVTQAGKQFDVGSGLAMIEVDDYESNPPIGKKARVRFEMYSDDGVPLKPTIEAIL